MSFSLASAIFQRVQLFYGLGGKFNLVLVYSVFFTVAIDLSFEILMHGDGYETREVFLFLVFVCIFGLDDAQNTSISEKITNQIFRLKYAQHLDELVLDPERDKELR